MYRFQINKSVIIFNVSRLVSLINSLSTDLIKLDFMTKLQLF